MKNILFFTTLCTIVFSCTTQRSIVSSENSISKNDAQSFKDTYISQSLNDSTFVNLKNYSNDFVYDMKYATDDNFLKSKVYDCAECYLRYKTVKALIKANKSFMKLGYKIKLFDCYRPLEIQKRMWKIVSNPNYVADPSKGSIHNRGGAVDMTLVDKNGKELDMGTAFDFFGKEAGHDYLKFSDEILKNRKLLKTIMTENNFKVFNSEWWHYNLNDSSKDNLSNFKWKCD